MNGYSFVFMFVVILALVFGLDLEPAVQKIAYGFADVLSFQNRGSNPAIYDLGILMALLIFVAGVISSLFSGRRDRDD